jgi:GNAT superfamily N-acetyltransferase
VPRIRPLTPEDAPAANATVAGALGRPESVAGPGAAFHERRIAHLAETDPGGAWLAEDDDGRVIGCALALVREGLWGLSLLGVDPARHEGGVGRALVEAAWRHGEGCRGHVVLASSHPAALRLYASLGLHLHPAMEAGGVADPRRMPDLAARVEATDDLAATEPLSRHVRGASHARDVPVSVERGSQVLLLEDRAWGLVSPALGAVHLVAGRDEEAASAVLWAAIAACGPGATVEVLFLTSAQPWAVRTCLDARLALTPSGATFLGGDVGPWAPYLPSGAWL